MTGVKIGQLPRNWERAFGYEGDARYVAFFWHPVGDEAMYDDGRCSGDGEWSMFLELERQRYPAILAHDVGSSDFEATEWLVLDRETRELFVMPVEEARALLEAQHPPRPEVPPEQVRQLLERWQEAFAQAVEAVNQAMANGTLSICPRCSGQGWIGCWETGYDPCPTCNGQRMVGTVAVAGEEVNVPGL